MECRWLQEFVVLILFDSPEVISTAKGISIGQMDFDNPKVDGVTSILNDLVDNNNDLDDGGDDDRSSAFFRRLSFTLKGSLVHLCLCEPQLHKTTQGR